MSIAEEVRTSFEVRPVHGDFVGEIVDDGVLRRTDDAIAAEVVAAMDRYAVCVFHNRTPLSDAEHIAFSRRLGTLQRPFTTKIAAMADKRIQFPEIIDVGNLDARGEIQALDDRKRAFNRGNQLWHTDTSFTPVRGVYSLLSAHEVPPCDADTEFADMRAAYDALPDAMKARIEDLETMHSVWYSRVLAGYPDPTAEELQSQPPARHRLVQVHPGSRRKHLYLASHCSEIVGWPVEEGRALLRELMALATPSQFVHRHQWRVGDIVIWDNRCTMHRGVPFDDTSYRRDMRRTTVLEGTA
ncbi:MAG: taurine catabolism dioxygenase tauD/tfdA [Rhodospirillales bacterium]|nr:taurine catabolism dioxygenase tauD/tfdA [Rhodospirillales bacterium]